MSCYHPLSAYQCTDGSIVFDETRKHDISRSLTLPCGQCIGCRLEKSRQWAMRCMHEAQLHDENCFITLTYNDESLNNNYSLQYEDFQSFMKNFRHHVFRKYGKKIRFYMAGEYGEKFGRPHWHACIFGFNFPDKVLLKKTPSGSYIYKSNDLEGLWPYGHSSIGDVTFESAAYVARYIMSKAVKSTMSPDEWKWVNTYSDLETGEIKERRPEFNKMSLKPGIGYEWYKKYTADVYPNDYVVIRGKKVKPPKFYDKKYKIDYPYEYDELIYKRENSAKLHSEDNTPERLAVKEQVIRAKLQKLKRSLT